MYSPFHEMDPRQFADAADRILIERSRFTRLRMYRDRIGLSQRELSEASGCSLRMIQYYEQKVKDINKAQGMTLRRLAAVFGCREEDLLEF